MTGDANRAAQARGDFGHPTTSGLVARELREAVLDQVVRRVKVVSAGAGILDTQPDSCTILGMIVNRVSP